jgi:hypothetical protein
VSDDRVVGVTDPQSGAPIRTGDIIPEPAIDARTGKLYVVWQDPRYNTVDPNEDQLVISSSSAGGLTGTWSTPTQVNDPRDRAAFTPAIKVLPNGQVAVSYYVLRGRSPRNTMQTQTVLKVGNAPERPLGDPFNMLAAPFAGGFFTGDYEGMAVSRDGSPITFTTLTNCQSNRCAAVAGFDADGNPIPSNAPDPTDVYAFAGGGEERR